MRNYHFMVFCGLFTFTIFGQQYSKISGNIVDIDGNPVRKSTINLENSNSFFETDELGRFEIKTALHGNFILSIKAHDFVEARLAISLDGTSIDLNTIILQKDILVEKTDNLIALTDGDLSDDSESLSNAVGLLQATRDIFLNRAAFDFGQAFFRVRGYDSREGDVLINGLRLNKLFSGRPEWNNWGGLNDVLRNQEFTNGLEQSDYTFGGILGSTNISIRSTGQRPGFRFSTSASNRTYNGRVMATYSSGLKPKGLAYTISASRRWADEGFVAGTLYDAYSLFGTIEYELSENHQFGLSAILAKNRKGRSSAFTREVFQLMGNQYNPYWGTQNGAIRNSRERDIFEPIFMINHYVKEDWFRLTSGIAYQSGKNNRSRLGYFNAPNPNPTYYRYLPSFYINNPFGADFTNAALAREGFIKNPQINWASLYDANTNDQNLGKASYILYDDVVKDSQWIFSSVANFNLNEKFKIDMGIHWQKLISKNYAEIGDLLGAEFHEDIDPFSNTMNDINGSLNKSQGAAFGYNYHIDASVINGFAQMNGSWSDWSAFLSGAAQNTQYQRTGLFQNERFVDNSIGAGETLKFSTFGIKGGLTYRFSGRHWAKFHSAMLTRPPLLQNSYVNPRESNELVPNLQKETVSTTDINYFLRLPNITGRVTGFYTRFQNSTDINFFFVDSGVGSDFVQEVLTKLDKLHMGIELGLDFEVSPTVKISLAGTIGKYRYASNPNVTINFDTASAEQDLIDPKGNIDLGNAKVKNLRLAQGPQRAVSLGVEYRDPKYWWLGATANHLGDIYANISTITRTPSFVLDPETGNPFVEATPENVARLLKQVPLDDFYLLNLIGGKSWLVNGKYISIFASINNLFDTSFRTGGYEQSRNGNFGQLQQDNLRDNPSFAPKYWYGFGRTYFINLAISF